MSGTIRRGRTPHKDLFLHQQPRLPQSVHVPTARTTTGRALQNHHKSSDRIQDTAGPNRSGSGVCIQREDWNVPLHGPAGDTRATGDGSAD